jgi:dethiobiotin synthetase
MVAIVFITGTDTAVGKTVLTALLVRHARATGRHALAIKPFLSGGTGDARILACAQEGELTLDQISPFRFKPPVSPLLAARLRGQSIRLSQVVESIQRVAARCELLFIEGAGGLLAPLGQTFTGLELMQALPCSVVVAAANKLGAMNHSLLTLGALRPLALPRIPVVLMNPARSSLATRHNAELIRELGSTDVFELPFLGPNPCSSRNLEMGTSQLKKTLAAVLHSATVLAALRKSVG